MADIKDLLAASAQANAGLERLNRDLKQMAEPRDYSFLAASIKDYKLADTLYEELEEDIQKTQQGLGPDEQILAIYYAPNGDPIIIDDIGYHNPYLLILKGRDAEGNKCRVLAHMNVVQIVVKILKVVGKQPRRQIGFVGEQNSKTEAEQ
ncbi:MAG: hypothetical protein ACM3US_04160 [Sphingomonadaceae bacterium]